MKRGWIALLSFCAVTTARAADLGTTFYFNPSLDQEANALVKYGGWGVTWLLVSQAMMVTLVCLPIIAYWRWPGKRLVECPGSAWEFAALCLYDRRMTKVELIKAFLIEGHWKDRDWRQTIRFLGFVLPWTVAAGSGMAVFSWWAVNAWSWSAWRGLRAATAIDGFSLVEPFTGLVAAALAAGVFFRMELAEANQAPDTARKLADPQR